MHDTICMTHHVYDHETIRLPVFQGCPKILHLELFVLCAGLVIELEPSDDSSTILIGEESGLIREVVNEPERCDPNDNCCQTF